MKLKYGKHYVDMDTNRIGDYKVLSNNLRAEADPRNIIINALKKPHGSKPLGEIVKKGDQICIVVSDITRAYQKMNFWLPFIVEALNVAGVEDKDIVFLSSNGAHRKQTLLEHETILGKALSQRFKIVEHDCYDAEQLMDLGVTKYGTPIRVNRLAVECDHLIITGGVTFHDMAGYGGGRKSVLPGICAHESIVSNHYQVFGAEEGSGIHPKCIIGNVEGNPMHLDMLEACEKLNISFAFNVVLDSEGNLYKAMAGDYIHVHEIGRQYCDDIGVVGIEKKADIVIASAGGYPKDINLYQVSKVHMTASEALKEGGTLIIVADCMDNMDADESVDIIMKFENNTDRERHIRQHFIPEAYSGYLICMIAEKYNVLLVSNYEAREEIEKSGMRLFRSLEEAMACAYDKESTDGHLTYIIPNATATLPKIIQ